MMVGLSESISVVWIREHLGALIAVAVLLFFMATGLDAMVRPRRHMNAYSRRGGDLLREWNEIGVQFAGLLFFAGSGWILYELIRLLRRS